jgi:hypothetical protein
MTKAKPGARALNRLEFQRLLDEVREESSSAEDELPPVALARIVAHVERARRAIKKEILEQREWEIRTTLERGPARAPEPSVH